MIKWFAWARLRRRLSTHKADTSIQECEKALEVLMRHIGYSHLLKALAGAIIVTVGRTDKLAFLAGGNPNMSSDVEDLYACLFRKENNGCC